MSFSRIQDWLGPKAQDLLSHVCTTGTKEKLYLPGPEWVDRIFA